jgi:hypothetical protein
MKTFLQFFNRLFLIALKGSKLFLHHKEMLYSENPQDGVGTKKLYVCVLIAIIGLIKFIFFLLIFEQVVSCNYFFMFNQF